MVLLDMDKVLSRRMCYIVFPSFFFFFLHLILQEMNFFPWYLTSSNFITKFALEVLLLHIQIFGMDKTELFQVRYIVSIIGSLHLEKCVKYISVLRNTYTVLTKPWSWILLSLSLGRVWVRWRDSDTPVASSSYCTGCPLELPRPILSSHSLVLNLCSVSACTLFTQA